MSHRDVAKWRLVQLLYQASKVFIFGVFFLLWGTSLTQMNEGLQWTLTIPNQLTLTLFTKTTERVKYLISTTCKEPVNKTERYWKMCKSKIL